MRAEVDHLRRSVETLGRKRRQFVLLFQNVHDLVVVSDTVRADVEVLKKRNMKLETDVCGKGSLPAMESACVKTFSQKCASVKSKLVASRMECANSR